MSLSATDGPYTIGFVVGSIKWSNDSTIKRMKHLASAISCVCLIIWWELLLLRLMDFWREFRLILHQPIYRCGEQWRIDNVQLSRNAMTRTWSRIYQWKAGVGGKCQPIIFPDNCMKMNQIGPEGGAEAHPQFYYVDLPQMTNKWSRVKRRVLVTSIGILHTFHVSWNLVSFRGCK